MADAFDRFLAASEGRELKRRSRLAELDADLEGEEEEVQKQLALATEPRSYSREHAAATGLASLLPLVIGAALAGKRGAGFGATAGGKAGTAYGTAVKERFKNEQELAADKYRADLRQFERKKGEQQDLNEALEDSGVETAKAELSQSNFERQEARLAADAEQRRQGRTLRPDISNKLEQQYFGQELEGDLSTDEARQLREGAQEGRLREKENRAKEEFQLKLDALNISGIEPISPAAKNPENIKKATNYAEDFPIVINHIRSLKEALKSGRVPTDNELSDAVVSASNAIATLKNLPGRNAGAALTPLEAKVYFKPISAFIENPTKGLFEIFKEEAFGQDPAYQLEALATSLEDEYTRRLASRGFGIKSSKTLMSAEQRQRLAELRAKHRGAQ